MITRNIVFIDSRVSGYESLIASLGPDAQWYLLDGSLDGIGQMQRILADYSQLDSIQIISHGAPGTLHFGSTILNRENLSSFETQLQEIGASLNETGDILLYGCDVAAGAEGELFIQTLAGLTGAEVAASANDSGPAALGGDGVLESKTGAIEAAALEVGGLSGVLAVNGRPTFVVTAGDGIVTTVIGAGNDSGNSVTVQTDGKILVAGRSYNGSDDDFALARYNSDGSLDSGFGGDGKVTAAIGAGSDYGTSVLVQPDGKILVGGFSYNGSVDEFVIVRYNPDGNLDTAFAGSGKLTPTSDIENGQGSSVAVQADGKILVSGSSYSDDKNDFVVVRYDPDGALDTTFGDGGKLTTTIGTYGEAYSVAALVDGKILVAGYSENDGNSGFGLVRYNADGSLDTSFSGDGKLITTIGTGLHFVRTVIVQNDGKILVAGDSQNGFTYDSALVRYNADGSLDTSFNGDGKLILSVGSELYFDSGSGVMVQDDGKILLAGTRNTADGNTQFALVRYNADGGLDTTFSDDGTVTTKIDWGSSGHSVTIQSDGKILVAGSAYDYGDGYRIDKFALVRYYPDGSLDTTFDLAKINNLDGVSSYLENDAPVILASNVQIYDPDLYVRDSYDGATLTLVRNGGASAQDFFSGADIVPGQASGDVTVSSTVIGAYAYAAGSLTITFNGNATQSLVNQALQLLDYSNSSDAPPASVRIAWTFNDGNTGTQGAGGALSVTGGTTINITAVNDAPVLIPTAPTLATITKEAVNNAGQTVASFLGSSISDVDANPLQGIALYGVTGNAGTWQYSINAGSSWVDVGAVSVDAALLLRGADAVRWLPDGANDTVATLSYYAWDQTSSTAGSKVDASARGGTTGFSIAGDTASITVADVNEAPTFVAGDGIVATAIGTGIDAGYSVAVQADGKILVAGTSYNGNKTELALARYNADGSLDVSFNDDGKLTADIGWAGSSGSSVAVQADGKILVAGTSHNNLRSEFALVRFNADGSFDDSFNYGMGPLTKPIGMNASGNSVTIQPDGKILVAGMSDGKFAVVRFNADGGIDYSFSGFDGLTTTIGTYDQGYSVTVQADGKILVAGVSYNGNTEEFALVRYNADGSLDTSFSGDGKLTTAIGAGYDRGSSVTTQADGKILVAGTSAGEFALVRYNADGSLDTSFSGDGKLTTAIGAGSRGNSVTVQADDKILVAGFSDNGNDSDFTLVRYNPDGSLDGSFGDVGIVTTAITTGEDEAYSVTVQADGKILVAGASDGKFAVVRYNADGSLDTDFDPASSLDDVSNYIENGAPVILDADVRIFDPDLHILDNYGGATLTLVRHGGADAQDLFSGAGIVSGQASGDVAISSTVIGAYAYAAGSLTITFNGNATQSLVNQALQLLAYSNGSDAPPASVQIDWTFNDGNTGGQGIGEALSITGSTTVNITAVNDAPLLTPISPGLTMNGNGGQTVASLLDASLADVDADPLQGIALNGVTGNDGVWQYTTNGGSTWNNVGPVSEESALLLRGTDSVRWLPGGANGTTATLSYYGWDQTSGSAGSKADVVTRGGTTAFSSSGDTASITVVNVNEAPSFGAGDGIVTTAIGAGYDEGSSVAVQADGKILVAGSSYNGSDFDLALARYNSDGSLDSSFDGDGKLTTGIGPRDDFGYSVTIQADGKILVAGTSQSATSEAVALVRYDVDGSLDTSFSGDGKLTTMIGTAASGSSVISQADGKILVAGSSDGNFALVRHNADGSLDTSFSDDGKLTTAIGTYGQGLSATVQADGKILVAGSSSYGYDFALARYNADGSLDAGFGDDGLLTTAIGTASDEGRSVTIQADGKILVAGHSSTGGIGTEFALVRYNADGSLDTSFSGDGKLTTAIGVTSSGSSVVVQADGKALVAGTSYNGNYSEFALARYNADGSLDSDFSEDGKLTTTIGWGSFGSSVTVQADGKILVAGTSYNTDYDYDFTLARYNADGSLDTTFDPVNSLDGVSSYIENGEPVILDDNVEIFDLDLHVLNNYAGATLTLVRHGGADAQDLFSGAGIVSGQASGDVTVSSTVIGTYAFAAGSLIISFNDNASQNLVNQALQLLAYSNSSDAPPGGVQIDWTFNDGNTGEQGAGGELSTTGSTTVNITAVNDLPTGNVIISGTPTLGRTLTAVSTLADADGLGAISYQWHAGGSAISGATESTFILTQAEVGKVITVTAFYTDGYGTAESVTSAATTTVAATLPIIGTPGPDVLDGTVNDDLIFGLEGDDILNGGDGNDTLDGGLGADTLNGGHGTDTVSYATASAGVTINLQLNLGVDDGGSYDTYTSIENAIGSTYDDVIVGEAGVANRLEGGDGSDTFVGEGIDTVIGGAGIDIFFGGQGAALNLNLADQGLEQVWGSYVGDVMDGTTSSADLILVGQGLTGGANADTMRGGAGDDFVYYRAGDVISGGGGNDWAVATLSELGVQLNLVSTDFENAWGSAFDDFLDAGASDITVVLAGDAGNDTLLGGNATDFLYGQDGDDLIDGGAGGDVLVGGQGSDTFVYKSLAESGLDAIFDFESGIDRLQLSAENFGLSAGAELVPGTNFIAGAAPAAGAYAGPTFLYDTSTGLVSYDADGSGDVNAEAILILAYQPTLMVTDFFFV